MVDMAGLLRTAVSATLLFLANFAIAPAAGAATPTAEFCHNEPGLGEICIGEDDYAGDVCSAIASYSSHFGLPEAFFARLIWQESRFDFQAISPAGARGIAQFMPSTAALRNLDNAFDPAEALARSAEYLKFLADRFGNLGLAAAAYNGGEGRVARYLAGSAGLAGETRAFVRIITGVGPDAWVGATPEVDFTLAPDMTFDTACRQMASVMSAPRFDLAPGEWQPYGVLIAQDFSADVARRIFDRVKARYAVLADEQVLLLTSVNYSFGTRPRYIAMVGRPTREEALALCRDLSAEGGICTVREN